MNPSIFNFNEHGVRIVLDDSKEPWFCLTDVYKSLDISRTSRLFRELDTKGVADCHILIETCKANLQLTFEGVCSE